MQWLDEFGLCADEMLRKKVEIHTFFADLVLCKKAHTQKVFCKKHTKFRVFTLFAIITPNHRVTNGFELQNIEGEMNGKCMENEQKIG